MTDFPGVGIGKGPAPSMCADFEFLRPRPGAGEILLGEEAISFHVSGALRRLVRIHIGGS